MCLRDYKLSQRNRRRLPKASTFLSAVVKGCTSHTYFVGCIWVGVFTSLDLRHCDCVNDLFKKCPDANLISVSRFCAHYVYHENILEVTD